MEKPCRSRAGQRVVVELAHRVQHMRVIHGDAAAAAKQIAVERATARLGEDRHAAEMRVIGIMSR